MGCSQNKNKGFQLRYKKSPFFDEKELPGIFPPETPFSSVPFGRI
jgi:hypothetical protein